jgi:hypothetical protein
MNIVNGENLRRLMPAFVVGGVLAFSFLAQAPSLASNNDVGYGYRNNCGVKGDGFHDHGKVCPNRPFPGQGIGVMRILGISIVGSESHVKTSGHPNSKVRSEINVTATSSNTSKAEDGDDSVGLVNGHGNGHGHGKGHGARQSG